MAIFWILFVMSVLCLVLSLCRASALADQHMESINEKWLREHPEAIQQFIHEEII